MIVADWRTVSAEQMAPLYAAERARWQSCLAWDYSHTLADIERARVDGRLHGVAAIRDGVIEGWAYFLVPGDEVHIGGIHASSDDVTRALVDSILQNAGTALAFGFFDAPGLERALCEQRFRIEPYRHLDMPLDAAASAFSGVKGYDLARGRELAGLLAAAYDGEAAARPFARKGTSDQWREYIAQLTLANGCGIFDRASSVMVEQQGRIVGAALVSKVSPTTAHLCQLAVHPDAQSSGIGRALLVEAAARARKNGSARMTLTVASSNAAASALYERLGFRETARFTFAWR